ncbi:MAG: TerB family tellurite resistance protein [Melioribacteraceae bacterium]|nr:TerB family tellurite resistance protein [Melioribacteraceae bacterium]MCO6472201.1 TerB family tellurite resistance protein [Melioribacteraceae bacterium]MDD3557443.1 TerB family tellurite resistance protein [Melioribacteraceae bacterium]
MINFFKNLFNDLNNPENRIDDSYGNTKHKVEIATCALFLEVAKSDDNFSKDEKKLIIRLMRDTFDLSEDEVKELIKQADEIIESSVSLYEFTDVINSHFSKDEKYNVVKNLWRLILSDEKINKYEEHFIRTINRNLHLEHKDLIGAKLEVKNQMN